MTDRPASDNAAESAPETTTAGNGATTVASDGTTMIARRRGSALPVVVMLALLVGLTFVIAYALGSGAFDPPSTNNAAEDDGADNVIGTGVGLDGISESDAINHLANRMLPGNNADDGNTASQPDPRPAAGVYLPDATARPATTRTTPLVLDPATHAFALAPAADASDALPVASIAVDVVPERGAAYAALAPVVRARLQTGATVRGRVVDGMLRPIVNAQITLQPNTIDAPQAPTATARIDAFGAFEIADILAGVYRLTIAHELFDTRHVTVDIRAMAVAVDVGIQVLDVSARWAGRVAVGVVEAGEPVEGVRVQLSPTATRDTSGRAIETTANARGVATFAGLLPGRYAISVLQPRNDNANDRNSSGNGSAARTNDIVRGRGTVHIVPPAAAHGVIAMETIWITLTDAGKIGGTVSGPEGEPVGGAEVVLVQTATGRSDVLAVTDERGTYRVRLTADQATSLPTARLYARDAGYRWYSEPRESIAIGDTAITLGLTSYAPRGRRAIVTASLDFADPAFANADWTAQLAVAFTADDASATSGPAPLISLDPDGNLTVVEFAPPDVTATASTQRRLVIIAPGIGAFSRTITLPPLPAARGDGRVPPLDRAPTVDLGALRLTRGVLVQGRAFALDTPQVATGDATVTVALPETQTFHRLGNGMIVSTAAPLRAHASADGAYAIGPLPVGAHRLAINAGDRSDGAAADATRVHDLWVYVKPSLLSSAEAPAVVTPRVRVDIDTTALAPPRGADLTPAHRGTGVDASILLGSIRSSDRPVPAGTLVAITLDGDAIAFVTTDGAGRVRVSDPRLTALDAVSIDRRVRFHLAGAPWPVSATRATVRELDDGWRVRDVTLHGLPILGRLKRADGGPLDGTAVALLDTDWCVRQVARPMRGDALALDHVPWGEWTLELAPPPASAGGVRRIYRIPVSVPEDTGTGVPLQRVAVAETLGLGRGRIVGHVVDALDRAVPHATVVVRWRPSEDGERATASAPYMTITRADENGRFDVDGLRAGHYVIHNVGTPGAPLGLTPVVVLEDIGPSTAVLQVGLAGAARSAVRLVRAGADVLAEDTPLALGPMGARVTLRGAFGFALPVGVVAGDPADWLGIAQTAPGVTPTMRLPFLSIEERLGVVGHVPGRSPILARTKATGATADPITMRLPYGQ